MDKKYVVAAVRAESKDIILMEIIDESSQGPILKTAALRLGTDEYEKLGEPTVRKKIKVHVEMEKAEEKAATP